MLPKSLLITIFVAVCIDKTLEDPTLLDCFNDKECYEKAKENNLHIGLVPILVTENMKKSSDDAVLKFFDDKIPGIKILKVNVGTGKSKVIAQYLYYVCPKNIHYPFVVVVKDNRLIDSYAHEYDEKRLNMLYNTARNASEKTAYVESRSDFLNDLKVLIEKDRGVKEVQSVKRKAAAASPSRKDPTRDYWTPNDVGRATPFDISLSSINNESQPAADSFWALRDAGRGLSLALPSQGEPKKRRQDPKK